MKGQIRESEKFIVFIIKTLLCSLDEDRVYINVDDI